eukprot:TRINITY_DN1640_c0_g1_i2.p1 TRINITY_DN1640_c0_g1~~TRINITY_DN1640_c0_g1_i2.p1  ORF type:complete len:136 (+),score=22.67 TRINITY_DN1640_c0_g1_i2:242-649(+)
MEALTQVLFKLPQDENVLPTESTIQQPEGNLSCVGSPTINYEEKKSNSKNISFECDVDGCSGTFSTKSNLTAHLKIHSDEKPFVCPEEGCTSTFKRRSHLKIHIRIHSDERPYQCTFEDCGKSFRSQSHLVTHER